MSTRSAQKSTRKPKTPPAGTHVPRVPAARALVAKRVTQKSVAPVAALPGQSPSERIKAEKQIGFRLINPEKVEEPGQKVRVTRQSVVDEIIASYKEHGPSDGVISSVMLPEDFQSDLEEPPHYIVIDGCHRIKALQTLMKDPEHRERFQSVNMVLYRWLTDHDLHVLGFGTSVCCFFVLTLVVCFSTEQN
jgi:hypothetical protein